MPRRDENGAVSVRSGENQIRITFEANILDTRKINTESFRSGYFGYIYIFFLDTNTNIILGVTTDTNIW
jgi:hypothetical protein